MILNPHCFLNNVKQNSIKSVFSIACKNSFFMDYSGLPLNPINTKSEALLCLYDFLLFSFVLLSHWFNIIHCLFDINIDNKKLFSIHLKQSIFLTTLPQVIDT